MAASRCNCTFCQKPGIVNLQLQSPDDFELLSPSSRDGLGDYNPNAQAAHKYFCKTCGVHVWAEGSYPWEGKAFHFFLINVSSVDQPQDTLDLSKIKISYCDGLNDNQAAGYKDQPWSCGLP